MTDLTKASEALLATAVYITNELDWKCVPLDGLAEKLAAIEAAVRSDTLADVAARLPEALHECGVDCSRFTGTVMVSPSGASPLDRVVLRCSPVYHIHTAEHLLAHLTGGTDR